MTVIHCGEKPLEIQIPGSEKAGVLVNYQMTCSRNLANLPLEVIHHN